MSARAITIGSRKVGKNRPAYIIAEIGSNFDNNLERAKKLARLSKEAGADAYKIQNFKAPKIVSNEGFKNLQVSFQSKWNKPVVEVYRSAEFPREWLGELSEYCTNIGIDFFSSPYDNDAVDLLKKLKVAAYKIGSGEIDNLEFLRYVAKTKKPVIIGAGSATLEEVKNAIRAIRSEGNNNIVLLQCVTNYPSPVSDANLLAMCELGRTLGVLVGYSDHTIGADGGGDDPLGGLTVPLGAIALGAVVIEKHITDDRSRTGPDHSFAMTVEEFAQMVRGIRAMEAALGDGVKRLMSSEKDTVIIQRRGIYATCDIAKGTKIARNMFEYLRPAAGLRPPMGRKILGKKAKRSIRAGFPIQKDDITF